MKRKLRKIILNDPNGGLIEERIARMAEALGISTRTLYRWLNEQPIPDTGKRLINHLYGDDV